MPGTLPILENYSDPVLVSGWTISPLSAAASWTSQRTHPSLSQRWWLEQDKEPRCQTRSHSRRDAAEQENKADGLQQCLYPKAMSVYSWAIRTLYSAPETTEDGHKFGGAVRLTQSQVWNSHCTETATTLQRSWCFTKGNNTIAVSVEMYMPALLDLKYLVCFQTSPWTQVLSFGFGQYILGTSRVKDTVALWWHLTMKAQEKKSNTGMPPFQESTGNVHGRAGPRWIRRWLLNPR